MSEHSKPAPVDSKGTAERAAGIPGIISDKAKRGPPQPGACWARTERVRPVALATCESDLVVASSNRIVIFLTMMKSRAVSPIGSTVRASAISSLSPEVYATESDS